MAAPIDPEKLVSVTQVAKDYGYHPKYFTHLASAGKIAAWRVGNIWISTRENIEEYLRNALPPGRPKASPDETPRKRHRLSTEKIKKST